MPLYRYECKDCLERFESFAKIDNRYDASCPECGSNQTQLLISMANRGFVLEPQYFEHLDTEPVWIKSKKHLKQECKKRGVIAKCLGD